MKEHIARTERLIHAPIQTVWANLTTPDRHAVMMFGADVDTDWQVGSPITWSGTWEGKPFSDHGEITAVDEPTLLAVTHFSTMSGEEDVPENRHAIEWHLEPIGSQTRVTLLQDGNATAEAAAHAEANWAGSLDRLATMSADD